MTELDLVRLERSGVDALMAEAEELASRDRPGLLEATAPLRIAIHLAPEDPRPTMLLSDVLRRLPPDHDDGEDARSAAIAFALRAVWLAPGDPDAHMALARACHRQHWFRLSIVHLQRSWELRPSAETAFWMAWMLNEIGDLGESLDWLFRARDLDPDLPGLDAEFGYAYRVLRQPEEAEKALREAVRKEPEDMYPASNLVLLLVGQQRDADAAAEVDAIVAAPEPSADLLGVAALGRWLTGDRDAAEPLLDRIVTANRSSAVGTWGTHAADLLAEIHWRRGNVREARELLAASASGYGLRWRRASEGWGYRFDLCRIAALQGETESALAWLRDAIDFGWNDVALARRDPMLDGLRAEVRLAEMLDEADARVSAMRESVRQRDS
jgi:tetratricopeptide (TPR) repeat protein